MRALIAVAALMCAASGVQAASWSDLWLTRDQQGQRLLEAGNAAEAARTFDDARRRAYAQIKAGRYDDAAKQLDAFEDPQSQYNRGNALAHSGKLEQALTAYDAAIKRAPADSALRRDAQHNRDLVAEQLRKQQSQSQQSSASDAGKQSPSDKSSAANSQHNPSQSGAQSSPGRQSADQRAASQPDASQQRSASTDDSSGQAAAQRSDSSTQPPSRAATPTSHSTQTPDGSKSADAAQARRDAEASLAQQRPRGEADADSANARAATPGEHEKDASGRPVASATEQPPSEQSLALDQWLRQIPDDPAGLLRRKFLIEHLRRQRESQ